MSQKNLEKLAISVLGIGCYAVGYVDSLITSNNAIIASILPLLPALGIIITLTILNKNRCKILRAQQQALGTPLTKKTPEGYSLEPTDIHEAIEKLGYLEYEKENEDEVYGDK